MSDLEKIYVFIPEHIKKKLESDCELFEIYKKNGESINFNSFCNLLILGYDDKFLNENNNSRSIINNELKKYILYKENQEHLTTKLIKSINTIDEYNIESDSLVKISFKPTNDTADIVFRIKNEYAEKRKTSEYFRMMFIRYCSKPMYIRERIIFSQKYKYIENACNNKKYLTFSTIWNPKKYIKVMPYKIVVGQEMYNYLICAGLNNVTGKQEAKTFRINRIANYSTYNDNEVINDNVINHLEKMAVNGPQYAINDDEKYCVRLTSKGIKSFNRIYYGRPVKVDEEKIGEDYYYYFNASENQMFLYFRRFGFGEAEIISPKRLRDKIIRFHKDALKMYEEEQI